MDRQPTDKDNDDDSVIYVSDSSIASVTEMETTQNGSIKSIVLDSSETSEEEENTDEFDTKNDVVLQEEKFVVTETVEEMQEEIVKKYEDKATQTYDKEFPTQFPIQTVTSALNTSAIHTVTSTKAVIFGPDQQSTSMASGSVPTNIATSVTTTKATNQSNRYNQKNATREKSPVRSNISRTRRTYSHTKSYSNYRVQPYRRYNNNYYGNYDRSNYRGYGNNYNNNNYYNRNPNNGYNRFGTVQYNNNNNYHYNNYNSVQRYRNQYFTKQFKERLFCGFIDLMDYVFDYDYSQDVRY